MVKFDGDTQMRFEPVYGSQLGTCDGINDADECCIDLYNGVAELPAFVVSTAVEDAVDAFSAEQVPYSDDVMSDITNDRYNCGHFFEESASTLAEFQFHNSAQHGAQLHVDRLVTERNVCEESALPMSGWTSSTEPVAAEREDLKCMFGATSTCSSAIVSPTVLWAAVNDCANSVASDEDVDLFDVATSLFDGVFSSAVEAVSVQTSDEKRTAWNDNLQCVTPVGGIDSLFADDTDEECEWYDDALSTEHQAERRSNGSELGVETATFQINSAGKETEKFENMSARAQSEDRKLCAQDALHQPVLLREQGCEPVRNGADADELLPKTEQKPKLLADDLARLRAIFCEEVRNHKAETVLVQSIATCAVECDAHTLALQAHGESNAATHVAAKCEGLRAEAPIEASSRLAEEDARAAGVAVHDVRQEKGVLSTAEPRQEDGFENYGEAYGNSKAASVERDNADTEDAIATAVGFAADAMLNGAESTYANQFANSKLEDERSTAAEHAVADAALMKATAVAHDAIAEEEDRLRAQLAETNAAEDEAAKLVAEEAARVCFEEARLVREEEELLRLGEELTRNTIPEDVDKAKDADDVVSAFIAEEEARIISVAATESTRSKLSSSSSLPADQWARNRRRIIGRVVREPAISHSGDASSSVSRARKDKRTAAQNETKTADQTSREVQSFNLETDANVCFQKARESSLARGYDALGVQLFSLHDSDELNQTALHSNCSRSSSVSAMKMDIGDDALAKSRWLQTPAQRCATPPDQRHFLPVKLHQRGVTHSKQRLATPSKQASFGSGGGMMKSSSSPWLLPQGAAFHSSKSSFPATMKRTVQMARAASTHQFSANLV
eukprot:TRINITY_DN38325_c0_g2_i1.p1 TRINITY_DN38325_c0_g2~~TRINITY_DN38325_c0_g2_i1.p1  ORF type:complete len:850 (-),score=142.90 TRINITY_DN38325_c0_g2_i1:403-2952(-)